MTNDMEAKLERTASFLNQPKVLELICEHVAEGDSVINLCKTLDLHYGKVIMFIHDREFPDRAVVYERSLRASNEWLAAKIIDEIKKLGFSDIREAFDENGNLLSPKDLPDSFAAAVSSIEVVEEFSGKGADREKVGYTKKIKLWDKLKSLELAMKNQGMLVDRTELSGKVTLEDLVDGSWDKDPKKPQAPAKTGPL